MAAEEELQTFELDDTNDTLIPVGEAIVKAIHEEYDLPEDAKVIPYTIDADAGYNLDGDGEAGKFEVGAIVEEFDG